MDRVALVRRGSATSLALTSLYVAGFLDFVGSAWSSEGRASEELEEVGQCDCREVCRLLQDGDVEEAVVQVVVSKMVGMMARCCRRRPMVARRMRLL